METEHTQRHISHTRSSFLTRRFSLPRFLRPKAPNMGIVLEQSTRYHGFHMVSVSYSPIWGQRPDAYLKNILCGDMWSQAAISR